jgi:chemotaxis protein MotA
MFTIVGLVIVLIAVLGGYLLEKGPLAVLAQPAELLIIGGAALGTLLIANPMHIIKQIASGLSGLLKPLPFSKGSYLETFCMCYELLNKARKDGLMGLEGDVEEPEKSEIFKRYPRFLRDHHTRDFVCDTLRMAILGGVDPFDMDQLMELDMEVAHQEASHPVAALTIVADSLPGLGIVAAVLGVVITMSALGGPPELIGHKVASALVGTFLGVLLCYGFVGPLAANMGKGIEEERAYHQVLRVLILAFLKGNAPLQALEFGRRAVPVRLRPSFNEMEKACKSMARAASVKAGGT